MLEESHCSFKLVTRIADIQFIELWVFRSTSLYQEATELTDNSTMWCKDIAWLLRFGRDKAGKKMNTDHVDEAKFMGEDYIGQLQQTGRVLRSMVPRAGE